MPEPTSNIPAPTRYFDDGTDSERNLKHRAARGEDRLDPQADNDGLSDPAPTDVRGPDPASRGIRLAGARRPDRPGSQPRRGRRQLRRRGNARGHGVSQALPLSRIPLTPVPSLRRSSKRGKRTLRSRHPWSPIRESSRRLSTSSAESRRPSRRILTPRSIFRC